MSFRLFIYYCALCGGCAAYVGWGLGRMTGVENHVLRAAVKGLFLGMAVALALGLIDALWNGPAPRFGQLFQRVGVAVGVGILGGFVGGFFGQALYGRTQFALLLLFGWVFTGALVGAAPGAFDYFRCLAREEDSSFALRKVLRGVLGGAVGGFLGGLFYLLLQAAWGAILRGREETFWSPSAMGFVVLGLCIGLLIGLAQVILKEAWLRVEAGFRPGRELMLSKPEITLGRAESCDLGLFGDSGVDKLHARLVRKGQRWLLVDDGSGTGTFLNGRRIDGPTPLRSGDEIRLGRNVLRFGERRRQASAAS